MDIFIHFTTPKFVGFYQTTLVYLGSTFLGFGLGAIRRYPGWRRSIGKLFEPDIRYYTFAIIGLLFVMGPASIVYDTIMDPFASEFTLVINLFALYLLCGYSSACFDFMADAWLKDHGMFAGYYIGKTWVNNQPYYLSTFVREIYLWPWNLAAAFWAVITIIWRNGKCPGESLD